MLKSLDRLAGATVDIPVALLEQKKAKIDAQTDSFKVVEASIAQAAASIAGSDPDVAQRAMNTLVRSEYRKQINRNAVAAAMLKDLRDHADESGDDNPPATSVGELDDDWLNVFVRFSEDASSGRLQDLWGRVLAGEIRRPGKFSLRTLRFLSEFSRTDALAFEEFAMCSFADSAPKELINHKGEGGLRDLVNLEASGLVQGVAARGMMKTITLNKDGYAPVCEGNICIVYKGAPGTVISYPAYPLSPLGQELLSLVSNRNVSDTARKVALAVRSPDIHAAQLGFVFDLSKGEITVTEELWQKEITKDDTEDGTKT